jgi:hydrogenase-4 component F
VLLFLTVIFAGFMNQMVRMFYGDPPDDQQDRGELSIISSAVLVILLIIITIMGFYLPAPLKTLIRNAITIISGGVNT